MTAAREPQDRPELVSVLLKQADAWKDQGVPLDLIVEFPAAKLIEEQAERIEELETLLDQARMQYAVEWIPGRIGAGTLPSREEAQERLAQGVADGYMVENPRVVRRIVLETEWRPAS